MSQPSERERIRTGPQVITLTVDLGFLQRVLTEFDLVMKLPPAVFIGNSVGGWAAARVACDRPEAVRSRHPVRPTAGPAVRPRRVCGVA